MDAGDKMTKSDSTRLDDRTRYYWCEKCQKAVDVQQFAIEWRFGIAGPRRLAAETWHWLEHIGLIGRIPCGPVVTR